VSNPLQGDSLVILKFGVSPIAECCEQLLTSSGKHTHALWQAVSSSFVLPAFLNTRQFVGYLSKQDTNSGPTFAERTLFDVTFPKMEHLNKNNEIQTHADGINLLKI
jgi:hypothetical protein